MKEMPMMTKKDAVELVELHADLCKKNPMERPVYDSSMVQTLGDALRNHKTTPELVAYVIENIFDEQGHEDMLRLRANPTLAILEMIARDLFKEEEEEK